MQNKKGLFIAIEGNEASGKSTQAHSLYYRINREYEMTPLILTSEPDDMVRELVTQHHIDEMTRMLLISAGRREVHERIIKPRMLNGGVVVTDRYFLSTLVYQHQWSEMTWFENW